jgi:hypothetical protein
MFGQTTQVFLGLLEEWNDRGLGAQSAVLLLSASGRSIQLSSGR